MKSTIGWPVKKIGRLSDNSTVVSTAIGRIKRDYTTLPSPRTHHVYPLKPQVTPKVSCVKRSGFWSVDFVPHIPSQLVI